MRARRRLRLVGRQQHRVGELEELLRLREVDDAVLAEERPKKPLELLAPRAHLDAADERLAGAGDRHADLVLAHDAASERADAGVALHGAPALGGCPHLQHVAHVERARAARVHRVRGGLRNVGLLILAPRAAHGVDDANFRDAAAAAAAAAFLRAHPENALLQGFGSLRAPSPCPQGSAAPGLVGRPPEFRVLHRCLTLTLILTARRGQTPGLSGRPPRSPGFGGAPYT
mmetsp:Transcript_8339/g.23906  ORF Transcript_8339/g.23906 Transcript_8339/m.23906 type:complete len:230 (+) Transcript_8339:912-1601(+)